MPFAHGNLNIGLTRRREGEVARQGPVKSCYSSTVLAPTPRELLTDPQGRPYFLWDMELTLDEFERALTDRDSSTRAYLIGKLMRQAKPDDALQFVSPQQIADEWPSIERYLGKTRPFWAWLLEQWERLGYVKNHSDFAASRLRVTSISREDAKARR